MTRRQQGLIGLTAITAIVAAVVVLMVAHGSGAAPVAIPSPSFPVVVGPTGSGPGASGAPIPATAAKRLADVLTEMHTSAFNPDAPPTKGSTLTGGLFVNWRGVWDGNLSTATDNTNVQTTGLSDDQNGSSPRHDPVTDLMYLRNLRAYKFYYPSDHAFDADAARMDPIVRAEFAGYTYYRSWIYFQLRDLDRFQPGAGWDQMAHTFVSAVHRNFYNASAGTVVDKSHGNYRTDFAAESAAAFADAGARYNDAQLTAAARATTHHLLASAQNPTTHLYPLQMNWSSGGDSVGQAQIKLGEQAQTLDALLTVYDHLREPQILAAVKAGIDQLYSPALGVHDTLGSGFFFSVNADGKGVQSAYKESRQAWMLATVDHLNREVGGQDQRIAEMQSVVLEKLWQSALHGYVYRTTPSFGVYTNHSGPNHGAVDENFVTSEAMGIAGNVLAP
jgi:hypothetical protein